MTTTGATLSAGAAARGRGRSKFKCCKDVREPRQLAEFAPARGTSTFRSATERLNQLPKDKTILTA